MAIEKFDELTDASQSTQYPPAARTTFLAVGEDDENLVEQYALANTLLAIATPFGILYRQPLNFQRLGYKTYHVFVEWSKSKWGPFQFSIRGRTTGGTQKIVASLATIATSANAPDFQGLIGVNQVDGTVEGADVIVPVLQVAVDVTYPAGFVNSARMASWSVNTPSVNSVAWQGWAAGEALYEGTEFEDGTDIEARVTHNFSISKNLTNFQSAGLTVTAKNGWDLLWFLTEKDDDAGVPIQKAVHWYVERIYPRTSFQTLFGF